MSYYKLTKYAAALIALSGIVLGYPSSANHIERSEAYCLAQVIYFEARGEPVEGQIAVAQVTLNRQASKLFPNTVCAVVYQTKPVCQYSWYCNSKSNNLPANKAASNAKALANKLLTNKLTDITRGALFFHASSINPRWHKLEKTVEIGNHIFYRRR
jgi:N-acetylmuramoyl-L-alanine amidase